MADAKNRTIEGWLIQYNKPSRPVTTPNGRKVYEVIMQDAFRESVDAINAGAATIECNLEHVDDAICRLGLSGKNVRLEHRKEGVYATIDLIGDSLSDDVFKRAQAGIVTGLSVEFDPSPPDAEPSYELVAGSYIRKWSKLTLKGFAICAEPMYADAQIVKATEGATLEGEATYTRSTNTADLERMQADIEAIETKAAADSRQYYEYQAFLLGIR
ncbi:MAG: HK97 family phage prohead protease [Phycisphaerales bacterium]|nr:HK97 family phage prohead protease [Phycisphaerales bacterium]